MALNFSRGRVLIREPVEDDDKDRYVIVVSREELNRGSYVTVVPLTTQQLDKRSQLPNCVILPAGCAGNPETSAVLCGSIVRMSKDLITSNVGSVPAARMKEIDEAIKWSLELD